MCSTGTFSTIVGKCTVFLCSRCSYEIGDRPDFVKNCDVTR